MDAIHERLDFTETIAAIQSFRARYPSTSGIYIERKANGSAAIAVFSQQIPGVLPVDPSRSSSIGQLLPRMS